jgi:predicted RNA-binding protein with RPS1 domain
MAQQIRLNKDQIEIGKAYPIQVVHIANKGIICKIVDDNPNVETTAFIHISKIANAFINDINEYVAVGDKFNAVGISTDNGNELSLQHLNLKPKYTAPEDKPIIHKKPYEKPRIEPATLDDMIEQANSSFRDKQGKKGNQPVSKRRKPFKKPQYD